MILLRKDYFMNNKKTVYLLVPILLFLEISMCKKENMLQEHTHQKIMINIEAANFFPAISTTSSTATIIRLDKPF